MANTKYDEIVKICGGRKNNHEIARYLSKVNMKQFKNELISYFGCNEWSVVYSEEPEYDYKSGAFKFTVSIEFCYTLVEVDDSCNVIENLKTKVIEFNVGFKDKTIIFNDKLFQISDKAIFDNIFEYVQKTVKIWDGNSAPRGALDNT